MITADEIKNIRLIEFIKIGNYPDYTQKYNLAKILLKKKLDAIEKIDRKKAKLEKDFGYSLPQLQTIYEAALTKNDLLCFYKPVEASTTRIKVLWLKQALDEFKFFLQEIVIDNAVESWGV